MPLADTLIMTSYPPSWRELAAVTCATHKAYADKHGYDYHADCSDLRDRYFNPLTGQHEVLPIIGFVKMDLFLHFLPQYKTVVWLDADLLVTNPEIELPRPFELMLPYDHNGHNATVIIAQSKPFVFDFFWACNNTGRKLFLKHDWREMEAMRYFLQTPPYLGMAEYHTAKELCPILAQEYLPYVPLEVSGKYGWEPGDWTLHLSALPLERRIQLAREYAEKAGVLA